MGLIEGEVIFDAPMKRYTSLKVGGPADCLLFPKDLDELRKVVLHAKEKEIPLFVLGNGTNLLVLDGGIRGWVVTLRKGLRRIRKEGAYVEAEAGCGLQELVRFSFRHGLTGFEPFFGIPGTVGGGLAMNAGAWGEEMGDVVRSVSFMDEAGEVVERPRTELRFAYRRLDFPSTWIILKSSFHLEKGDKQKIHDRMTSFYERRKRTQPLDYPSAGSIFKNPEEGPAGKWIEESGLKGFRIGEAMVSEKHANFIINLGRAKAEEVLRLIEEIERRVYEEKGIRLKREVKVVGEASWS
ncbi:MAG: UDP-N-acetylmuramate dehydrogenase [Desulfobacterota bacterium]|nr:UDP-N-acetylmuramate dehydrogenase [Thermodesulfobacteriota bacterium]